ncbi:MAG: YkoF family thiamine/hydroxymethylpyrimidine-binding protein [Chlorobiota bacterium]|jgi:uncharacterized protein YqgV (UPF0045/DUF77 family)|nr:YkoF family thiamine/hydroxymethylpyrimidine-binding protein [Chlorobiota bacterium]
MEQAMMVSATVAVYPLRQPDYRAIEDAIEVLTHSGLSADVQPMHTELTGELDALFEALRQAFLAAARHGVVVMTLTLTNACTPTPRQE